MTRFRWIAVTAALVAIVAGAWWATRATEEPYAQYVSPNGDYKVVVFREVSRWATMPGQAGDAPGRVVLEDRSGRRLREEPVEMVQLVESVQWEPSSVTIVDVGQWRLGPGSK